MILINTTLWFIELHSLILQYSTYQKANRSTVVFQAFLRVTPLIQNIFSTGRKNRWKSNFESFKLSIKTQSKTIRVSLSYIRLCHCQTHDRYSKWDRHCKPWRTFPCVLLFLLVFTIFPFTKKPRNRNEMSVQVGFDKGLLKYEIEIIRRLAKKESLVVLAAGLSVEALLLSLIKPYCETDELIFIVNGSKEEAGRVSIECQCAGVDTLPLLISDYGSTNSKLKKVT